MSKVKTDNSFLADKVSLRKKYLPEKTTLKVLDLFHGNGEIWKRIKKETGKNIDVLGIDKKKTKNCVLVGDNMKFLPSIDIHKYDIIDLDAYGIPFEQLDHILNRGFKGDIFITYIQSVFGAIPSKMLKRLGYSKKMIRRNPAIFYRNGMEKLKNVLSTYGIKDIFYIRHGKKIYARIKFNPE